MSTPFNGLRAFIATHGRRSTRIRTVVPVVDPALLPQDSKQWKRLISSISISVVVHAILLFTLSWFYFDLPNHHVFESILWLAGSENESWGDSIEIGPPVAVEPANGLDKALVSDEPSLLQDDVESDEMTPSVVAAFDSESTPSLDRARTGKGSEPSQKSAIAKPAARNKSTSSSKSAAKKGANTEAVGMHADHFVGRGPTARMGLLKRMGGTDASEAAVSRGLNWLKNHQLPDGSWNFYHLQNPRCDCTMPGRLANNPNAATAMALLAFLGAGQTNETGDYQPEVQQGLDFLLANGTKADRGISFYGQLSGPPTFYTHGLVTIALSEAFAMTGEMRLRPAISGAIEFLVATQENGGGWRYFPGQPGDTSVVAWQLMALKSAQFSRITVQQKVFNGVDRFLNSVTSVRGSQYAYTADRRDFPTASMTAAGVLCRMYLDWKEDDLRMRAGIRVLDERGPDANNMYYNYYATQVMHHWGGPEWDRWNGVMRDHLITTQIRDGHAAGSWDVADPHGVMGGRVYMTTLALLTLEVYYRHLPLYQKDRIEIPLLNEPTEAKAR